MNLRDADNGKILWQSNDDMYVFLLAYNVFFKMLNWNRGLSFL